VSHHNTGNEYHGIKASPGSLIKNCKVYNNGANGITSVNHSTVDHCYAHDNPHLGIEADGENITIKNSFAEGNYIGIYTNYASNAVISNCFSQYNTYGISTDYYSDNIKIEKCTTRYNSVGIEAAGGSENITITKNLTYGNSTFGIAVQNHNAAPGYNNNIHVNYNITYGNETFGIHTSTAKEVNIYNNTVFNEKINITSNNENVNVSNNIFKEINGNCKASNNLIDPPEDIFFNAEKHDFRLREYASSAIDQGADVHLSSDFGNNFVPFGDYPDIGAFEYIISGTANSPPAAPTGLILLNSTSRSFLLSWTDNANNEYGFEIERSESPNNGFELISTSSANIIEYTDHNLNQNTSYYYRVRAFNHFGYSDYSNILNPSMAQNKSFILYPMPCSDVLNIKINEIYADPQTFYIYIYDISGKIIFTDEIYYENDDKKIQINLSHLNCGAYIIEMKSIYKLLSKQIVLL
jgi:hypothetical protein